MLATAYETSYEIVKVFSSCYKSVELNKQAQKLRASLTYY
jgi:hypothetical protein